MKVNEIIAGDRGMMASWLMHWIPDRAVWRVRALDGVIVLCSCTRHLTLKMPLSTQVYKWVPTNLVLGVTMRWSIISSRGRIKILIVASCYTNSR